MNDQDFALNLKDTDTLYPVTQILFTHQGNSQMMVIAIV